MQTHGCRLAFHITASKFGSSAARMDATLFGTRGLRPRTVPTHSKNVQNAGSLLHTHNLCDPSFLGVDPVDTALLLDISDNKHSVEMSPFDITQV
ncbi:hypothetical protein PsorP6_011404 [Peronosclerospora sorghi]|uniref:Uncharacterized protein n=1 Tax=Peronosclerospora sorghi TaxID=230839 RepID=A0ACC0WLZ1_9STRA|nr:hypothetical protein PsorP6_011404 [Peronosclerospora sorghi]